MVRSGTQGSALSLLSSTTYHAPSYNYEESLIFTVQFDVIYRAEWKLVISAVECCDRDLILDPSIMELQPDYRTVRSYEMRSLQSPLQVSGQRYLKILVSGLNSIIMYVVFLQSSSKFF